MPKKAPMKKSDSKPRGKAQKSKVQKSKSKTLVATSASLAEREYTEDQNMDVDPLVEGIDLNMVKQEIKLETEAVVGEEVGQISANAAHTTPETTVKIEPESLVMEALINPAHGMEAHSNPTPAPATVSTPVRKKKKTAAQKKKAADKFADELELSDTNLNDKAAEFSDESHRNVVEASNSEESPGSGTLSNIVSGAKLRAIELLCNEVEQTGGQLSIKDVQRILFGKEMQRNVTEISHIEAEISSGTSSNNVSLHDDSNEIESERCTDVHISEGQESVESMDSLLNEHNTLTGDDTEETYAKCSMSKIVPGQSVKRAGSPIAAASGSGAKKRSRKQVEIPERAWIEALKSLSCPKWSKMRLVSRQLNGVVGRNVSCLPLAIIDSVVMKKEFSRKNTESTIIASDTTISPDEKINWFKDRGVTLHLPANIELNNAIIGFDLKDSSFNLVIQGDREQFNASVLFKAEFSPHRNPYSWPSMAYFLKLIYDQSTFVKELSMYAFDKKLKDILFSGEEERYIRCGTFNLDMFGGRLRKSLSWLEQNVQADMIKNSHFICNYDSEDCDIVSNFILGASWISASQVVNLGSVQNLEGFFRTLIQKFRTLVAAQSTFPIIQFRGNRILGSPEDFSLKKLLSGKEELDDSENAKNLESSTGEESGNSENDKDSENSEDDDESEDSEDDSDESQSDGNKVRKRNNDETYTISNGSYRMRVVFENARIVPRKSSYWPPPKPPTTFDIRMTVEAGE
ncbi:hypothetical protein Ddc_13994 [Ditylenchus destructor]|nr:hypothetical protein Ddc_13994 [Ditylenchus destructor]